MGDRYFITGVQLGILRALAININSKSTKKLLKEIEENQYLCEVEANSKEEAIDILKEDGCEDYARDTNREIDWDDAHISEGGVTG